MDNLMDVLISALALLTGFAAHRVARISQLTTLAQVGRSGVNCPRQARDPLRGVQRVPIPLTG